MRSAPPGPTVQEMLEAYASGAFPMDGPEYADDRVPFYLADPRTVLPISGFRIPKSVRRGMTAGQFTIRINQAFAEVCTACAIDRDDTWLSARLIDSYIDLHRQGHAHSVEVWRDGALVGGLFGVSVGGLFTSESMFHRVTNAGNAAIVGTAQHLVAQGFALWDIQMSTAHTRRFGAEVISHDEYRTRLRAAIAAPRSFTRGR